MSEVFPLISPEFELGDFGLPPRPSSADRTRSPAHVSEKREYIKHYWAALSGHWVRSRFVRPASPSSHTSLPFVISFAGNKELL